MAIQSLQRAVAILNIFSSTRSSLGVTEIADALELNKGTVWGLITTLVDSKILRQNPSTKRYQLGPKLYELGLIFINGLEVNRVAVEPSQRLADQTDLEVWMGIWDGESVLATIHKNPKDHPKSAIQLGPKITAHTSAVGKAALAWLPTDQLDAFFSTSELKAYTPSTITHKDDLLKDLMETRRRGYAISRQESVLGRSGIGAPIFDASGELSAVIGVTGRSSAVLGNRLEELAEITLSIAREISENLGYFP